MRNLNLKFGPATAVKFGREETTYLHATFKMQMPQKASTLDCKLNTVKDLDA